MKKKHLSVYVLLVLVFCLLVPSFAGQTYDYRKDKLTESSDYEKVAGYNDEIIRVAKEFEQDAELSGAGPKTFITDEYVRDGRVDFTKSVKVCLLGPDELYHIAKEGTMRESILSSIFYTWDIPLSKETGYSAARINTNDGDYFTRSNMAMYSLGQTEYDPIFFPEKVDAILERNNISNAEFIGLISPRTNMLLVYVYNNGKEYYIPFMAAGVEETTGFKYGQLYGRGEIMKVFERYTLPAPEGDIQHGDMGLPAVTSAASSPDTTLVYIISTALGILVLGALLFFRMRAGRATHL